MQCWHARTQEKPRSGFTAKREALLRGFLPKHTQPTSSHQRIHAISKNKCDKTLTIEPQMLHILKDFSKVNALKNHIL